MYTKKEITQDELDKMLELHSLYLQGNPEGAKFIAIGVCFDGVTFRNKVLTNSIFIDCSFINIDDSALNLDKSTLSGVYMSSTVKLNKLSLMGSFVKGFIACDNIKDVIIDNDTFIGEVFTSVKCKKSLCEKFGYERFRVISKR